MTLILSVGEGGTKVNFCLVRGGCDLILSRILPISQPPLQIIIAQSLMTSMISVLGRALQYSGYSQHFGNLGICKRL